MVALLNYREDGTTPFFSFFKDGLKEQKFVRPCFSLRPVAVALTSFRSPSKQKACVLADKFCCATCSLFGPLPSGLWLLWLVNSCSRHPWSRTKPGLRSLSPSPLIYTTCLFARGLLHFDTLQPPGFALSLSGQLSSLVQPVRVKYHSLTVVIGRCARHLGHPSARLVLPCTAFPSASIATVRDRSVGSEALVRGQACGLRYPLRLAAQLLVKR